MDQFWPVSWPWNWPGQIKFPSNPRRGPTFPPINHARRPDSCQNRENRVAPPPISTENSNFWDALLRLGRLSILSNLSNVMVSVINHPIKNRWLSHSDPWSRLRWTSAEDDGRVWTAPPPALSVSGCIINRRRVGSVGSGAVCGVNETRIYLARTRCSRRRERWANRPIPRPK